MPRRKQLKTIVLNANQPTTLRAAQARIAKSRERLRRLPNKVMQRTASQIRIRVMGPMLRELRRYPPRQKGMKMRWKSPKQRRYVLMMLRRDAIRRGTPDDISYRRKGALGRGWNYTLTAGRTKLKLRLGNTAISTWGKGETRYYIFVVGGFGFGKSARSSRRYRQPIQPFHKDRGWKPAFPTIQHYVGEAHALSGEVLATELEAVAP